MDNIIELKGKEVLEEVHLKRAINNNVKTIRMYEETIRVLKENQKQLKENKEVKKEIPDLHSSISPKSNKSVEVNEDYESNIEDLKRKILNEGVENIFDDFPISDPKILNDYIFRLKLELLREIKDCKELLTDEECTEEDKQIILNDIETYFKAIKKLSIIIEKNKEDENNTKKKNQIILFPNEYGNIKALDMLKDIDQNQYGDFLKLFLSIEDGSFKGVKKWETNIAKGIFEVKEYQARVVFERIDEDKYAIISIFVKKADKTKKYQDKANIKLKEYISNKGRYKKLLENPKFLEENQFNVEELFNILGYKKIQQLEVK